MTKLADVQQALKVPKDQLNKFGGYKYRTCGAILEAAKPHMTDATVTLSDEIVQVGDRFYIKATATFRGEDEASVTAWAREPLSKKGMDEPQITGTASTYARKVALGGLFAIDDSADDPDATNDHGKGQKPAPTQASIHPTAQATTQGDGDIQAARDRLTAAIEAYCARYGADVKKAKEGIAKRPDYNQSAEFYNKAAAEFENMVN